jgi:hypothetical protein
MRHRAAKEGAEQVLVPFEPPGRKDYRIGGDRDRTVGSLERRPGDALLVHQQAHRAVAFLKARLGKVGRAA